MKTVEVSLEFAEMAHKAACSVWKERIEKEIPELRASKNGWYYYEDNIVYYNGGKITYGFWDGRWRDNLLFSYIVGNNVRATNSEVSKALGAEADKRYSIGDVIVSEFDDGGMERTIKPFHKDAETFTWYYDSDFNGLRSKGGICTKNGGCSNPLMFKDGKWVEKVEPAKLPKSLQEAIDKLGREKVLELLTQTK